MDFDARDVQRWLSRHLVSMVHIYRHLDANGNLQGDSLISASSCFVMSFGERWFLVTAGHVLKELEELLEHPRVRLIQSCLIDALGSDAIHNSNLPFTYDKSNRFYIDQDGLDFGLIPLSHNHRQLLEANRVVPVAVENWINQDIDRCHGFLLLGIPVDWVSHAQSPGGYRLGIETLLVSIKRLTEPPPRAETTMYERFIGDLTKPADMQHGLEGTSGGPIFGFYDDDNGQLRYWIVALQSSCLDKRYVFGCPVKLFGNHLLARLLDYAKSNEGIPLPD
jgi:hypothetical protein